MQQKLSGLNIIFQWIIIVSNGVWQLWVKYNMFSGQVVLCHHQKTKGWSCCPKCMLDPPALVCRTGVIIGNQWSSPALGHWLLHHQHLHTHLLLWTMNKGSIRPPIKPGNESQHNTNLILFLWPNDLKEMVKVFEATTTLTSFVMRLMQQV